MTALKTTEQITVNIFRERGEGASLIAIIDRLDAEVTRLADARHGLADAVAETGKWVGEVKRLVALNDRCRTAEHRLVDELFDARATIRRLRRRWAWERRRADKWRWDKDGYVSDAVSMLVAARCERDEARAERDAAAAKAWHEALDAVECTVGVTDEGPGDIERLRARYPREEEQK